MECKSERERERESVRRLKEGETPREGNWERERESKRNREWERKRESESVTDRKGPLAIYNCLLITYIVDVAIPPI